MWISSHEVDRMACEDVPVRLAIRSIGVLAPEREQFQKKVPGYLAGWQNLERFT
jgi:hypothetical protein